MKFTKKLILLCVAGCWCSAAKAQLEMVTSAGPQSVFSGDERKIAATFHNPGAQDFSGEIRTRVLQTTSATSVPLGEKSWKELRVLPEQTVLETAAFSFPAVKAETKFLIQWVENTNHVIGRTEVLVYPTNLLHEMKLLVKESWENLGVLDPKKQIVPTLKQSGIGFVNLAETERDSFSGKLAVIGPCGPDDSEWSGLADHVRKLAQKGTPVVWIQKPSRKSDKIQPSFYVVAQERAAVVVVQPELVADLEENPQAQLNFVYFCKLALNPQHPSLPDLSEQSRN